MLRARVDRHKCVGAGNCITIAPTGFDWVEGDFSKAEVLDGAGSGQRLSLHVSLSHYGEHDIGVEVRWCAEALVGVQYVGLTPAATTAVRRYVAELLERGAHS